jgi:uncharacterized protein YndB with AHSA1/START domain
VNPDLNVSGNSLQITRVFSAPRALVFSFWTKAETLRQWSGCKEAIACEVAMDFRVGGTFIQKMRIATPDGACDFTLTGTYDEIVAPERIVYHADIGNASTQVTVEFFEYGEGTKLVLTQTGFSNEFFCQNVAQGTSESFDKLDALLGGQAAAASQL